VHIYTDGDIALRQQQLYRRRYESRRSSKPKRH